jgi:hypothetical protein
MKNDLHAAYKKKKIMDLRGSISLSDIPREKLAVPRYQNASAVMMWGAISMKGLLPLVFIDRGVKINAEYYKTEFLERILLPEAQKLYGNEYYCCSIFLFFLTKWSIITITITKKPKINS